jgi:hypothetical protein
MCGRLTPKAVSTVHRPTMVETIAVSSEDSTQLEYNIDDLQAHKYIFRNRKSSTTWRNKLSLIFRENHCQADSSRIHLVIVQYSQEYTYWFSESAQVYGSLRSSLESQIGDITVTPDRLPVAALDKLEFRKGHYTANTRF